MSRASPLFNAAAFQILGNHKTKDDLENSRRFVGILEALNQKIAAVHELSKDAIARVPPYPSQPALEFLPLPRFFSLFFHLTLLHYIINVRKLLLT